ncbi:LysR family transcriptional regulator [Rhizobium leguminosarum bv. viciae]|uniref:LysR family transcriptional regulator n=1 Tax=Rhizobium leguminosarum TaxID=384 RepID=UPI00103ACB84|nr:LysR family transcriptional regulator [Rhizobium leguminosarum]MBY5485346.1 LysR family transcriptional regulator [Rhizobium leguminosarum]TBY80671.1 LysR family transcriptional regulator [Rhizobium leguminosarum bv. viciae]TBZ31108.1 LysR family transcriptional regulator [Rhizobium leguminosarum bv. viciae]TBZ52163.1 LysR family transcriptional regulator [Rhizobium leguminosarum bv. viciae]TBZ72412.1 LysR family transcriptional regulator [Rhizobium leguminosarum bv. viciae]
MDRIDAMKVFVTAVEEGSLAGAARRLKRSPTAISRALGLLEQHVGVELLHRTTRSLKLSEAGQRYVEACRRVLVDLEEADMIAGSERSSPRGTLTISAPPILGEEVLRPILDSFLRENANVSVRLLMLDRFVNLVDEGVDVALRIGNLADSTHMSTRIGGDVRRVVVAAPQYLDSRAAITEPSDLSRHDLIAFSNFGLESWSFAPAKGTSVPRTVHFTPRYLVNSVRAAAASAAEGMGVTRLYSYHVAEYVRDARLRVVLPQAEPPALPVHILTPQGRAAVLKVRTFIDFAVPRLRSELGRIAAESGSLE